MNKQLIAGAMSLLMMSVSATSVAAERISTAKHEVTKMTSTQLKAGVNAISFQSQGVNLSANLYLPANYTPQGSYPAVIFSPPFNQVKEQTGAVYAEKLAKLGYATLVFDHLGYGDSEGALRNNENSFVKIESIRDAVSFMGTVKSIDKEQLFGLGVCASGGYMALVATTDKRLKAIATVSGMMGNKASYFESMDRETITGLIAMQNAGRQKAYETGVVDYVDALGLAAEKEAIDKGATPSEGYDYYMTERAGAQTYANYTHLAPSFMLEAPMLADAQSYAPYLYTPYIGIIGSKAMDPASGIAMTGPLTKKFYDAASEPKKLVEIKGASHVDLYDRDEYVNQAVAAMDKFFKKY
ncbi:alpha/beta hydrolase [Psychrobium sp. MM17-31]|uniref:alpha/beta hydrolase n=1 Tax=Psychrobium sp. MM17-31 TaxID=2917758 RepID=UPI001EF437C6|nr:alpha/beta hydrolase [Psychrobium sp. MM17-31]MCG7532662.1 alpha/beta hydrolase [Psychrobium sp. MM17-31]